MIKPTRAYDFKPEELPVVMTIRRVKDDEIVWTHTIREEDLPAVIDVPPGLSLEHGPCWARIEYANGVVEESR